MKRKLITMALSAASAGSVFATGYSPVAITPGSYNADIVVEKGLPSLGTNTTATVDGGTNNNGNTWYEVGYNAGSPASGLPAAGTVLNFENTVNAGVSNVSASYMSSHSFKLAPSYSANNAYLIDTAITSGMMTLTTPAIYSNLAFMVTSGNGGGIVGCVINHADGTSETNSFACGDWFGGTANVIYTTLGRVNVRSGNFDGQGSISNPGNPRMYGRDVPVSNTSSPIVSVHLLYGTGAANVHNQIYGISGSSPSDASGACAPIDVTGYNADCVVETDSVVRGPTGATTQSMDSDANTGNSWYEQGFYNTPVWAYTGIPHPGANVTNAARDHVFTLAPDYTANNVIYLNPPGSNAVITLSTPSAFSGLSFLNSSGNGPRNIFVVVSHQDGTSETNIFASRDWFDGNTAGRVIDANGRVAVDTRQLNSIPAAATTGNAPYMFNNDLILNNFSSPVTSIQVYSTNSTGRTAIFAISGTTGPIPPSFTLQPSSTTAAPGDNVQFSASASANDTITYRWQKGTNGVYVNLTDGGNISGSTTTALSVNSVGDADEADYRVVATDSAGSVNSSVASLTVLSSLSPVTVGISSGDAIVAYQPNGGSSPTAESVDHAIDQTTAKYLNFGKNGGAPFAGPVGFVVTPAMGRTRVTAIQMFTANDAPERDPANYVLEGSDDGGATWTLISSNNITMPGTGGVANDGRNPVPQTGPIPITDNSSILANTNTLVQKKFTNTSGYTMYRWWVSNVRNNATANSMQIAEVRLLGAVDTSGLPTVSVPPSIKAYRASGLSIPATVTGSPFPTLQWQKQSGGSFVNLTDAGVISGSQSQTLNINPTALSDAGNYRLIASNTSGSRTSTVVAVTIISTLADISGPNDTITDFGNLGFGSPNAPNATSPFNAIDDTLVSYGNTGVGPSAGAGYGPFFGPVGVILTPAIGRTVLQGLRFYPGPNTVNDDPADYALEGSNDAGSHYTPIASGALGLPADRNSTAAAVDPINAAVQEVLFSNNAGYTTYRLTIHHVKDDGSADRMDVGEIEFLGFAQPTATFTDNGNGTFTVGSSSGGGEVQSTTNLTNPVWVDEGPAPLTVTPSPSEPQKFYRVVAQ